MVQQQGLVELTMPIEMHVVTINNSETLRAYVSKNGEAP